MFKRLNDKKVKLRKDNAELARDPNKMQKQFKLELNKMQSGVDISSTNTTQY